MTLFFGGQSIPVTQVANPCPLTLLPSGTISMPANGGTGSFTVTTSGSSCSYATFPSDGVTILSGATGSTFPATVTFSVPPNTYEYPVNRVVQVSSVGAASFAPGVWITQAGTPITTDEPANGLVFVVHRGGSGSPHITAPEPLTHCQYRESDRAVDRRDERALAGSCSRFWCEPGNHPGVN